jgi:ribosome maturation factor RimP
MKTVAIEIRGKIESLINSMGYEFVGCEWHQSGRRVVLRIYIDSSTGVTLGDCSRVSHQVGAMLDVEDPSQGQYLLEISSPGIDRPLFEMAHYEKQIGQRIKLTLSMPIQKRRRWIGMLVRIENEQIHLLVDAEEIVIPFSNIEKANVIAGIH